MSNSLPEKHTVYVLGWTYEYEGSGIVAVYTDKTKAELALEKVKENGFRKAATYWLNSYVVNYEKVLEQELE